MKSKEENDPFDKEAVKDWADKMIRNSFSEELKKRLDKEFLKYVIYGKHITMNRTEVRVERYKKSSGKFYDTIEFQTELPVYDKTGIIEEFKKKYDILGNFSYVLEVSEGKSWNKYII